ncbi:DedA family protein [Streptomyces sp. NPDC088785]|uniref:DedA family protein n=1 Tax=Streptomyces sp. NPDC088785 TaxID=3365897 RepID=UPI00381E41E3
MFPTEGIGVPSCPDLCATAASHPLAVNVLDAGSLLTAFGALGVAVVLFAETGLLIGFFLPGDSLLFTAGLLCASGRDGAHLSLPQVLLASVAGALAGAQVGYWIGRKGGRALLARSRSRRLRDGAARAEELLARYGHAKAIVLARFVPVVRTVLNPLAGALDVPARTFVLWQSVGGAVWTVGLVLAGYALGSSVPDVDRYLLPLVALVVAVSLLPLALEVLRARRNRRRAAAARTTAAGE